MKKHVLIAWLFSLLFGGGLYAQDFSNKGKDFWLGYGYHVRMLTGTPLNGQDMVLYFTSDQDANVTVEIPGLGYAINYRVIANQVTVSSPIPKTGGQDARLVTPGVSNKGIHITSDKPIVAYAHIYNSSVSGASLLFPTNTLGKEYYSINYAQNSNENASNGFFFVVATEDNTKIGITPSASNTNGLAVGVETQIDLNKGQVYTVMGTISGITGVDLTGSKIRSIAPSNGSCKPIAVFSGSGKISIGGTNTGSADNLFAQAFPSNAWGTKYLTAPTGTQPNNFFRVCVRDPSTVVKLNGVVLPASALVNNFYYQFKNAGGATAPTPNLIEADKPILVAQYCTTQGTEGNPGGNVIPGGDPEMIYLSPVQQTIKNITLYSASQFNILQSFINVIIKKEGVASFKIDGGAITPTMGSFVQHPNEPNYMYATLRVSNGSHRIESDSGFNAIAYGFGNAESYGYNAGTNIVDLNPPITIQNEFSASNVNFSATCSNSPFKINLNLTYRPTKIELDFNNAAGLNGPQQFVVGNGSTEIGFDSTYVSNGKTYFLFRIAQTYSFNTAGSYPVKIKTTSQLAQSDGCSNTNEQEITDNVVVNAPPTASFSFVSNGCINSNIPFTDASEGTGRPIVRWLWEFSDNTTSTLQNPIKTFTTANNHTAKLTAITDFGCIAIATQSLNLSSKPIAGFTAPAVRCETNALTLNDASSLAVGTQNNTIVRWTWQLDNGGGADTLTTPAARNVTYAQWGTKDVRLVVASNTGCVSDTFRLPGGFQVNPLPQVGFVLPEVCLADANAPFTDTTKIADGSGSLLSYAWKFNDGPSPISPGPNIATSTAKNPAPKYNSFGNYVVSLTVTSNNGCASSLSQPFTVNGSIPNPSFTVVQANPLCSNDSIRIINTSTVDFGNITRLDITWDTIANPTQFVRDESPSANKVYSNLYAAFTSPASKNVGIKILAYSGNSAACQKAIRQAVPLINAPKASFADVRDICLDAAPRTLNQGSFVSALSGTGVYSGPGTTTAGILNPVVAGVGNHVLKYTVTNSGGCKDSATQPITVWPSPQAKWGVQSILCERNDIQFTDSSVANFSNITQRIWDFGNSTSATFNTAQAFVRQYAAMGNYTVGLRVVTDSGCVSPINAQSIVVNPLPQVQFSLPNVVCLPDGRANFTNASTIADGSQDLFSYAWNFGNPNDPSASTLKSPTHRYSSVGPFNVQLKITSNRGCVDSLTQVFNTVYPWPKAAFSATPQAICLGDTIRFRDLGDQINSGPTVQWRWDLGQQDNSAVQNPLKQFRDSGQFNIRYYFFNDKGCVSDTVSQTITVHPYPVLQLVNKLSILEGGTQAIKPKFVWGSNLQYQWSPPTYLSNPTDSTPITTPLGDIRYRLDLTGIGGCTVSDTVFVKLLLSPVIPNAFSPNGDGINDRWVIQYLESYPGASVEVFNRYGQLVFSSIGYSVNWDGTYKGQPLPIGTYYYVINPKNGRKTMTGSITILR